MWYTSNKLDLICFKSILISTKKAFIFQTPQWYRDIGNSLFRNVLCRAAFEKTRLIKAKKQTIADYGKLKNARTEGARLISPRPFLRIRSESAADRNRNRLNLILLAAQTEDLVLMFLSMK